MKGLTQQQFKDKMKSFQDSAQTPLLVGVDQEGGLVSRLTHSGLVQQMVINLPFQENNTKKVA